MSLGWLACTVATVMAQLPTATTLEPSPPGNVLRAIAVDSPPVFDGRIIGDPIWNDVPVADGFLQSTPNEGALATEHTEVRVVFTVDTVFIGVVCFDRDPQSLVVSDSSRDSSMNDADSVQIVIDTFHDEQNGFIFGTTPAGQEYDGQVANEGGTGSLFGSGGRGGFSRGSGGGFNLNWDGVWQVRTTVSEIGWSAEFAIPFRTIRYPTRPVQTWGINIQRNIRRRNETSYWAPLPRQYNLYRISMAGDLVDIQPSVGSSSTLRLAPYAIGQLANREVAVSTPTIATGDFGVDLKYGVTSGLTLDATYNTDFAQVEVDNQQINLDRFNLFFPEKRPFFLENAGAFAVSNEGPARSPDLGQTDLFFSRRIGISDSGQQIPILAGSRLSGKVSNTVTVGFLNMQTETVNQDTPANNFTVARVRRDLPNRSSLGGLFVNRTATGPYGGRHNYNRTFALDGRWGLGDNGLVQGFVGRTQTPGRTGRDHALNFSATYSSPAWRVVSGYQENGEDFNPEVGFLRRPGGFRKFDLGVNNTSRPNGFLKFQEFTPHMSFTRFWNLGGTMETSFLHWHFTGEFSDSSSVGTWYDVKSEHVFRSFTVSGLVIPPGRYDFSENNYSFNYNRAASISFGFNTVIGGFFGGQIRTVRPSLRARYGETFNVSLSYSRNDIDLPVGSTITNLASIRLAYNVSPRVFAQALMQYNDSAKVWSSYVRFGWLQDANTGLFIVYNEIEGISDYAPLGAGRSLIVKYSFLLDVLE